MILLHFFESKTSVVGRTNILGTTKLNLMKELLWKLRYTFLSHNILLLSSKEKYKQIELVRSF